MDSMWNTILMGMKTTREELKQRSIEDIEKYLDFCRETEVLKLGEWIDPAEVRGLFEEKQINGPQGAAKEGQIGYGDLLTQYYSRRLDYEKKDYLCANLLGVYPSGSKLCCEYDDGAGPIAIGFRLFCRELYRGSSKLPDCIEFRMTELVHTQVRVARNLEALGFNYFECLNRVRLINATIWSYT